MKTAAKRRVLPKLILVAALIVAAILLLPHKKPEAQPVPDEHEGQVYIFDGQEWTWMTPLEGVEPNPFTESDFRFKNNIPTYLGGDYDILYGIDVSEHQKVIDWSRVAASGVDFAIIRVARRGTTEGGIYYDDYFTNNFDLAVKNGLKVGVYFFSQAVTVAEAMDEAEFVIRMLAGAKLDLPVVFDWEEDERTAGLDDSILNDCAVAFCETVKKAGYEPCVYFSRLMGYYRYDLERLDGYKLWFSLPELGWPSFYYNVDMWQYSFNGTVPGIDVPTDMNIVFIPK